MFNGHCCDSKRASSSRFCVLIQVLLCKFSRTFLHQSSYSICPWICCDSVVPAGEWLHRRSSWLSHLASYLVPCFFVWYSGKNSDICNSCLYTRGGAIPSVFILVRYLRKKKKKKFYQPRSTPHWPCELYLEESLIRGLNTQQIRFYVSKKGKRKSKAFISFSKIRVYQRTNMVSFFVGNQVCKWKLQLDSCLCGSFESPSEQTQCRFFLFFFFGNGRTIPVFIPLFLLLCSRF